VCALSVDLGQTAAQTITMRPPMLFSNADTRPHKKVGPPAPPQVVRCHGGALPSFWAARSCRVSARRPPGHLIAAFEQRCGAVVVHERPREFPGGFRVARESHARPCAGAWLFVFGEVAMGRPSRATSPLCGAPARERVLARTVGVPYCAATLSAACWRAARAFTTAPVSESVPNGTVSPSPGRVTGRSL
jgi:hypothetical protein